MSLHSTPIHLGERYRDTVTGFEGVASAVSFYLYGPDRVSLEAATGEVKVEWFDSPRLEPAELVAIAADEAASTDPLEEHPIVHLAAMVDRVGGHFLLTPDNIAAARRRAVTTWTDDEGNTRLTTSDAPSSRD